MILFHFSWQYFGLLLLVCLSIYYAVVLRNYCGGEIKAFLDRPPRKKAGEEESEPADLAGKLAPEPGTSNTSLDELMQGTLPDCLDELNWFFSQAATDRVTREDLPALLRPLLEPYESLLKSELRDPIEKHILSECQEQLGYELTDKELAKCLPKTTGFPTGKLAALAGGAMLLMQLQAHAQDGNAGLTQATSMVQGYFSTGCTLMYAIGAVIAIVGGIKTFQKWNAGEPDTAKVAASWFGSCIFLVVVATVIKSFFGV